MGDMDSWEGEIENIPNGVHLIEEKAQDTTDFQKALSHLALYEDLNEIVILGGLGQRTDHLISNFMTASKVNTAVVVIFDSEKEWIRRVTPQTPLKIMGQKGATVSLLPLSSCKSVLTTGLEWEIKEKNFSIEGTASQSNIFKANESHISLDQGSLLVILQK
jgi:thiamine pyrophosphokinase